MAFLTYFSSCLDSAIALRKKDHLHASVAFDLLTGGFLQGSGECTGDVQKLKLTGNAYYEERRSSYDLFLLRSYDPEWDVLSNSPGKSNPLSVNLNESYLMTT